MQLSVNLWLGECMQDLQPVGILTAVFDNMFIAWGASCQGPLLEVTEVVEMDRWNVRLMNILLFEMNTDPLSTK